MANLLARLADAFSAQVDEVPEGWRTADQIAAEAGKSTPTACRYLKQAIAAGLVEMRPYRIRSGTRVYPVPHYREIEKRGKK
jgi:predicted transcriptional regulator